MKLSGVIPATVLPFSESGPPDLEAYRGFIDHLIEAGAKGLTINADSGEGMSLWPDERRAVMRAATEAAEGRVPLISGLIASFTDQARLLAQEAAEDGATHIMVFPNVHWRGQPQDSGLIAGYFEAIHDASGLPLVAFQLNDALGGVEFTQEALEAIVSLPSVTAIKDASFDALTFRTTQDLVRRVAPDVSVLTGNDNFIYESFLLGVDGALIGAGSIATEQQVAMFEAVQEQRFEDAAELESNVGPLIRWLFRPPVRDYRGRIKAGLVELGILPSASVRPPLRDIAEHERREIAEAVRQAELVAA